MADLRQRLMAAMDASGNQWFDSYDGEADAALTVFAEWLRDHAKRSTWGMGQRAALLTVADEIAPKPAPPPEPPKVPCPEGFHWLGQSFAHCDKCGLPAWEHEGTASLPVDRALKSPYDDTRWVLKPWEPGEREACRAKWEPTRNDHA